MDAYHMNEKADHDLLVRIDERLAALMRDFEAHVGEHEHDRREWRNRVWQVAFGGISVTGIVALVTGLIFRAMEV